MCFARTSVFSIWVVVAVEKFIDFPIPQSVVEWVLEQNKDERISSKTKNTILELAQGQLILNLNFDSLLSFCYTIKNAKSSARVKDQCNVNRVSVRVWLFGIPPHRRISKKFFKNVINLIKRSF